MLIYKKTFENIKTKNYNFPIEDQFYASDHEAIVADGVTRDPIGISDFSKYSHEDFLEKYPRPSGAEIAAKEICETFSKTSGSLIDKLVKCNENIKRINEKYIPNCNYLENDYYAAVTSCIKIENNTLHYAYICDCGVIVYDKFGNVKFQTEDDKKLYSDPYINKIGISWDLPEARVIVRRDYRNNLNNIVNGKCVSYGAITGEDSALKFIRSGKVELSEEDIILVYSDGFYNFLHEKDFISQIINFEEENFEKYVEEKSQNDCGKHGGEKTIVLYKGINYNNKK